MLCRLLLPLLLLALTCSATPQTLDHEFARADKAWQGDDFSAAESHFSRALELTDDDENARASALYGRGVVRLEQHKWQGANDDLTRSLTIEPGNADAWMARGMARKGLGDYTGLLSDAHEAARLDPEWKGFEDDAQSTVNWRRAMLGFLVLAGFLVALGAVPLVRSLTRMARLDREARQQSPK